MAKATKLIKIPANIPASVIQEAVNSHSNNSNSYKDMNEEQLIEVLKAAFVEKTKNDPKLWKITKVIWNDILFVIVLKKDDYTADNPWAIYLNTNFSSKPTVKSFTV